MKKFICLVAMLVIATLSIAQLVTTPAQAPETDYLDKAKKQRTTARLMLGTGIVLLSSGFIVNLGEEFGDAIGNAIAGDDNSSGKTIKTSDLLIFSGLAVVFGSIHFFNRAHKNRRQAAVLAFTTETVPQLQQQTFSTCQVASLTLKISL